MEYKKQSFAQEGLRSRRRIPDDDLRNKLRIDRAKRRNPDLLSYLSIQVRFLNVEAAFPILSFNSVSRAAFAELEVGWGSELEGDKRGASVA